MKIFINTNTQSQCIDQAFTEGLARPSVPELDHNWWGEVAQLEQDRWAVQTLPEP